MPNHPIAYKGSEPYIFVSYAHKESDIILPLIQGLQDRGFRVWYDAGIEVGTEWPDYIAEHLNGSACVIAFISRNSMDSHNCRREINFAIELRKDPLVIYMEELELPMGMRMQLGSLHAMFYYRHTDSRSFLDTLAEAALLQPCRAKTAPARKESTIVPKQETKPVKASELQIQQSLENGRKAEERGDYAEAAALYRFAAERGDAEGQYLLAQCLYNQAWDRRKPAEAIEWEIKAAQQGHKPAQMKLGDRYFEGAGVKKNLAEAAKWYRILAEQGDVNAQFQLARCYDDHWWEYRDPVEAAKWERKAAQQGRAYSQTNLGERYLHGNGVKKDAAEAVKWFRRAAAQGDGYGQLQLAKCYEQGLGVSRNLERALEYYEKAAAHGYTAAKEGVERCKKKLKNPLYHIFG